MTDNLVQLQKLTKLINTDKILGPDDVDQIIGVLIRVLANNKKGVETLNSDTKATVDQAITFVSAEIARLRGDTSAANADTTQAVETKLSAALRRVDQLIAEAKAAMPQDGKDANPEDVVPLVMAQIKLPEQKAVILDGGEEIVSKINDLGTEDDQLKIDASHIKNLPQIRGGAVMHGGFRNLQVFDETTLIAKAVRFLKFVGTGVQATAKDDVVTVTIPGSASSITPADEAANDSGDHTTFTISHTPVANTLLVINQNSGQAVPTSAYTNTTTSIIFNQSQAVDDGAGNLVTPTFRARYFY